MHALMLLLVIATSHAATAACQRGQIDVPGPSGEEIIAVVKTAVEKEIAVDEYEYRLNHVEIEDDYLKVYLDLQFSPSSAGYLRTNGRQWLDYVGHTGLRDEDGEINDNVFGQGRDVRVLLWTYVGRDKVIPWGHATYFADREEKRWFDGEGMKLLEQ